MFGNSWTFVSRYRGVLSQLVKFIRSKKIRKVTFHIFRRKKNRNLWKIYTWVVSCE